MKRAGTYFFWLVIALGLIVRIVAVTYNGTFDIATYYDWGINTLTKGLDDFFHGTYFPFQYQIFAFASWLSLILDVEFFVVFKSFNLIFDCGNLFVLFLILNKLNLSKYYLILYWIHPWFLNMFSLGYSDFHFTFFILCTLYFTLKDTLRDYLIAGIFLSFAFMMKPQVQIILLSFFIYGVLQFIRKRELKTFHIFVFPVILFINYWLYFLIKAHDIYRLIYAYLDVANVMPCLNANFLNGWFPVAYFMKGKDEAIYSISDEITLLAGLSFRKLAILLVLILITWFIIRLVNRKQNSNLDLYIIATFSTFAVPFLMTSAHENHLFPATVLIIPVLAMSKNLLFKISVHVILFLQFINLYGFYGVGDLNKIKLPRYNYTYDIALILSMIAFFAFLIMVYYFTAKKYGLSLQFPDQPAAKS